MAKLAGVKNYHLRSAVAFAVWQMINLEKKTIFKPSTAYARSKVDTEKGIKKLASDDCHNMFEVRYCMAR